MNTINLDALDKTKYTSRDFNPLIAVKDNHLLATSQPSYSGTFEFAGLQNSGDYVFGSLPAIRARKLRITNSNSSEVLVTQKVVYFSRYFDESTLGVIPDSSSIEFGGVVTDTPLGKSQVLRIKHSDDTSLYLDVPTPENIAELNYQVYFKVIDLTSEIQPIGIYNRQAGIDINYPSAAIRVLPTGEIQARHGYTSESPAAQDPVVVNQWYRANIRISGTNFSIAVDKYTAGVYTPNVTDSGNRSIEYTSTGASKLDDIFNDESHSLAFASEGPSEMYMENLEVFVSSSQNEVLPAGQTKEYFVRTSLDEIQVKGPVTGYYMA